MKFFPKRESRQLLNPCSKTATLLSILSIMVISTSVLAADFSVTGESTTILRLRTTVDSKDLYPAYEYLRLNTSGKLSDGSTLGLYFGGWGRVDLGDRSTDKYSDTDLQYFYASYRLPKNNTAVSIGRQFVTEGVASEKIDGLSIRGDLLYGISASAFAGESVTTGTDLSGSKTVYGTRISHSSPGLYTLGVSALKSEASSNSRYREEEGIDIWVHPARIIEITGRSSYNSLTSNWMEHSYTISATPLKGLNISTNLNSINYTDYFYNMTTSALSLNNSYIMPGETMNSLGVASSYTLLKDLTLAADYKHYSYDIAGNAEYFGFNIKYSSPKILTAGFGVHRMDGSTERLRYTETRLYALKKFGAFDISADLLNIDFDNKINGVKDSYSLTGSGGYELTNQLKLAANVEYSRSPDFDNEVKALVKLTYLFDTNFSQGGSKREK